MATGIYARISDDREGDQLGVRRQLEDCRALADRKNWGPVVEEYVDNDVSAYRQRRPAYRQMLDDIAAGTIKRVVVYHLDRLHRQPRELEEFFDVCDQAGVTELASVTGDVDLSDNDGRFMARIQGAVARKESDDKSRRIRRKALELARNGKVGGGGTRPFGFEDDRVTVRVGEATVIRDLAQRALAGEAVRALCFDLNERGIRTSTGREWVPAVLTRMLKSARISGRREHHGEIVADAEWPAIIPAGDGDRLRAVLSDPARRKNSRAQRYLLAGMLRCGRCGEPLVSRPRDDGRRRYVCGRRPGSAACGKLAVVADELEALVAEMVMFRLEGPDLTRALFSRNGDDGEQHQHEVDESVGQLEELAAAYGERRITLAEWLVARTPIEDRLSRAKLALARSSGVSAVVEFIGDTSALRDSWAGLPLARRRAILTVLIDHVTVAPARRGFNRFDPNRVAPVWNV